MSRTDAGRPSTRGVPDAEKRTETRGGANRGPAYFLGQVDPDTLPEEGWIEELVERSRHFRRAQGSEPTETSGCSP